MKQVRLRRAYSGFGLLSIAAIAVAVIVGSVGATATASPSAAALVAGIKCLGLPIGHTVVYTAATDPNHLLGRPGGYISKANFRDTRLTPRSSDFAIIDGGSVETFLNADDAQRRQTFLETLAKGSSLLTEYDYRGGTVLLRLSSRLTPIQAGAYKSALATSLTPKAATNCKQPSKPVKPKPSSPPKTQDARVSPYVGGNASPHLAAGPPGTLAVIARGPYQQEQTLPIIVRNNTTRTVIGIAVAGTASSPGGRLLATGKDQSLYPNVVKPGEIALGYVYFNGVRLPANAQFRFKVTSTPPANAQFENRRDLIVLESHRVQERILGTLRNGYPAQVTGPIEAFVACFSSAGKLLYTPNAFTDQDTVAPKQTLPFQVDASPPYGSSGLSCPVYLVAASGYTP